MSAAVQVPVLLSFDGKGGVKIGRGEAGWTVMVVPESAVVSFLEATRASWMPGTRRLAALYGVTA